MNKRQRAVYLELATEIRAQLCTFCKYSEFESDGCCAGWNYCTHPIDKLAEMDLGPGCDCWGFRPGMSLPVIADIVGAIISQGYNEWGIRIYSPAKLTVFGRKYVGREEFTSKVRINYEEGAPVW